jgi:mannose-6-phosphate isomerase-like protein (cupin superfamily)
MCKIVKMMNRQVAEHYQWGAVCDGWRLLDRSDLSVIQERIPPDAGEVTHFHRHARQLFFVIEGQLQIELAGEVFALVAGDALEVPPEQPHRVRNVSAANVSFLVVSAPSTRGDRVNSEG